MWERWDGIRPDGSFEDISRDSFNHYAFGAIGDWMYRTIGGIDLDQGAPGYKHSIIAPHPGGGLTSARASLFTGYGLLSSSWRIGEAGFELDVEVPANTSATVTLPKTTVDRVREGGIPLGQVVGVRSTMQAGNDLVVELGSGRYAFRVR